MSNIRLSDVEKLISQHRDVVDFGTKDNAIDDEWIERAEKIPGLAMSPSYNVFLKNYVGGETGDEEIYSIFGIDFETVCGGNIFYQNLTKMIQRNFDR